MFSVTRRRGTEVPDRALSDEAMMGLPVIDGRPLDQLVVRVGPGPSVHPLGVQPPPRGGISFPQVVMPTHSLSIPRQRTCRLFHFLGSETPVGEMEPWAVDPGRGVAEVRPIVGVWVRVDAPSSATLPGWRWWGTRG